MFTHAQAVARRKLKGRDVSFRAFLERQRLPGLTRTLATMMVQGFDAADPRLASAREILDEWTGDQLHAASPERRLRPAARIPGTAGESPAADRGARSALEALLGRGARHLPWRALVGLGAARGDHASDRRAAFASNQGKKRGAGAARLGSGDPRSDGISRSVLGKGPSGRGVLSFPERGIPDVLDPAADARAASHRLGRRSEGRTAYRLFGKEPSGPGAGERAERTREYR